VRPLLLDRSRVEAVITVDRLLCGVSMLGHVALGAAYPSNGVFSVHHRDQEIVRDFGSDAAEYRFIFTDGEEIVSLKHGVHVLRGNDICRWWKTAPRGPETTPAIRATVHPSYEVMRIDLWQKRFQRARHLREIRWRLVDLESVQALYAITSHDS
jgi:hypothetical protein